MSQTIDKTTRGKHILDIYFTNIPNLHEKTQVISGVGDHEAVSIESKLFIKTKKPIKREIKLWNQTDMTNLKKDAKNFCNLFKAHFGKHS